MSDFDIQPKTDTLMNNDPKRFCVCLTTKRIEEAKAALLNAERWPAGTQVTVKFLEGRRDLQKKVQAVVQKWTYDPLLRNSAFEAKT
jgi:hypothetical protein